MTRKITYLVLLTTLLNFQTKALTTKIQLINNSADAALSTVDIYIDNLLVVNDLSFREATALFDVTANSAINIGIARGNSLTILDTFKNFNVTLSNINNYVGIINGIKSTTGYTPAPPITLDLYNGYRDNALSPVNVDILFANGVTDGQTMDLRTGIQTLADNVAYKSFGSYYSISSANIKLRLTNNTGSSIISTYSAPFSGSGYTGLGAVVIASGFAKPSSNSNGPVMGLWACTSAGGPLEEFMPTSNEAVARCQFIHNCADTTADTIDVYVDGIKKYDDMRFRNAGTFFDVFAKFTTSVAIAPRTSTSVSDAFYTQNYIFDSAGVHLLVATGIQSSTGYTPKPAFMVSKYNNAREEASNSSNTDALFINGSTDASSISITDYPGGTTWYSGVAYNSAGGFHSSATANTKLKMTNGSNTNYYDANFQTLNWQGQAVTILASGFTDTTVNSKGSKLGLWVATSGGGALTQLPPTTVGINPITLKKSGLFIYPVPANNVLNIYTGNKAVQSASIIDLNGRLVTKCSSVTDNKIDVSNLPSGSYTLQFSVDNSMNTIMFTKQ